jgi:putative ABC transport system permease protein
VLKVFKLAARNLARYQRRTLLTTLLIVLGVLAVLLFVSVSGSFKRLIVGQITDSMLGHVEVHRRGYVASIDNLPLNLNMKPAMAARVDDALKKMDSVEAWSPRLKFGAMFSNFTETTSIRLNGVDPAREAATCPLMLKRFLQGTPDGGLVERGKVLIPDILATGMKIKVGDTVVLVATNLDGSVNGKTFIVQGVLDSVTGPGGRDGYINIDDARELLRLSEPEVSEIAIRLKNPQTIAQDTAMIREALADATDQQGRPALEVHTWDQLTPFASIAAMIDLLTLFIKVMLIGIVLISIMNVMVMAVYERIREIGTIAAIGTLPGRILALFMTEGLLLGVVGAAIGAALSLAGIYVLNVVHVSFTFARQQFTLAPTIGIGDILVVSVTVIFVAVLASLQPAWKASRMDPITALRHV